jgi:hypothetical protein
MQDMNLVAVLVAGVVSMVIGALWYSPALFGNAWMKLAGVKQPKKSEMGQQMALGMGLGLVAQLVMAFVLAYFFDMLEVADSATGATVALWAWLGFMAPITAGAFLWEGKSVHLFFLNGAYWLVAVQVMALVLTAMA